MSMQSFVEKLTSTPEGLALFQQEGFILEVTELICALMRKQGVSKSDLAARLGKSRAYVTQMLAGRANMTLRTISDVLTALGESPRVTSVPLTIGGRARSDLAAPTVAFSGMLDPASQIDFDRSFRSQVRGDHPPGTLGLTA